MKLLSAIKRRIPAPLRQLLRGVTDKARLSRAISPFLPEIVCVDVGASYYPHAKWYLLLDSPATRWIAVEPNEQNLGYIAQWRWRSSVTACRTGLSRDGGEQTLYVTNVDSGSSLLEPRISPAMERRILQRDYFFPLQKRQIQTLRLQDVLESAPAQAPVFVKLDTQGTELSILLGAAELLRAQRVVGIELEATLLAEPIMVGSGKFWQACEYLENLGFELLHVEPIYGPSRIGLRRPRGRTFINECDAVFALRQDVAAKLAVEYRAALFAFYVTNQFLEEALLQLQADSELSKMLADRGCSVPGLVAAIRSLA
jgi:FkbM family methyltransferase